MMYSLKSLRSVQISILKPKITPEVLRFDQYCERMFGMLATKSFFSVSIWCGSVAKFVTLSVIDDFRIISVINRVASKSNSTTKSV